MYRDLERPRLYINLGTKIEIPLRFGKNIAILEYFDDSGNLKSFKSYYTSLKD